MELLSYLTTCDRYLDDVCPGTNPALLEHLKHRIEQTAWEEPESALDCNNGAVMALMEADATDDPDLREMYLEMAIDLLNAAADHPLCAAHLAMIQSLVGEGEQAIQLAFATFMQLLQRVYAHEALPAGLVYLPKCWRSLENSASSQSASSQLEQILMEPNGYQQSLLLLGEVLIHSQFVFYNPTGLRFLQLADQLLPPSAPLQLSLGISTILNGRWEGLLQLHRAHQLAPYRSAPLQALYLAYRDLNQADTAALWLKQAQEKAVPDAPEWEWTQVASDRPFTYVPFETQPMAVEASFQSIVTAVLLAEGKWFEREMEFWQDQIQPGMTVIDVGANVGVYTFSAAYRTGNTGRVLAVEPFSGCVQCLQETRRMNQLDWVTVCRGAASDRDGTVRLALQTASELNQVLMESDVAAGEFEQVPCFSLDTLLERERLSRVDLLKIDAEGHELQVLMGSDRLLKSFSPTILYENIAGSQGSNLPVAEFLTANGYQLYRYQPFIKRLIPLDSQAELQGNLNIIALPQS